MADQSKENDAPTSSSQLNSTAPPTTAPVSLIPSGPPELDEWGLPIRHLPPPIHTSPDPDKASSKSPSPAPSPPFEQPTLGRQHNGSSKLSITSVQSEVERIEALRRESAERARNARRGSHAPSTDEDEEFEDAVEEPGSNSKTKVIEVERKDVDEAIEKIKEHKMEEAGEIIAKAEIHVVPAKEPSKAVPSSGTMREQKEIQQDSKKSEGSLPGLMDKADDLSEQLAAAVAAEQGHTKSGSVDATTAKGAKGHARQVSTASQLDGAAHKAIFAALAGTKVSEWSHQAPLASESEKVAEKKEDDEWQEMPAYAPYDIYDDDNKLVAREAQESDDEDKAYGGLGGAGKGYTRVMLDEDAQSATSMDENTGYLFKETHGTSAARGHLEEDDEVRDAISQLQATKDLLTEGQRIAYVGMTRLVLSSMMKNSQRLEKVSKGAKKETALSAEAMLMWSQKMMIRLYVHMDISAAEQVMIEQLAEHGVVPEDLTPTLMANARVKNPMAEGSEAEEGGMSSVKSPRPSSVTSPRPSTTNSSPKEEEAAPPPPAYEEIDGEHLPEVRTPSQLPTTKDIDIDLRWTILCDLFLTLIVDSIYDARSRVLLEQVGSHLDISWLDICRFEKRVTDALEMQQAAEKENWDEHEHLENRRKMALTKRYVMMGLATVGGGLVIGLSGGLAAPIIGAGLAAGFTTIGVAGTATALTSVAAAGIIGTGAAATGSIIGVRAANRRTGAVKTFEYRPLHNNKRVNLIVTVSGWMTGKVDDVRLPYSTVDPIMGDIYSVLWEPEMLQSMGATINILATEALTQGLQQALAAGLLTTLMGALQLPLILTKLSYLIDNPWSVSVARADAAGLILADSLVDRNLGTRPITFVGYSLGSRVIYSCLRELSRRGAHGLVQNVYLFGTPVVATKDDYLRARSVVAGRFVNGYATNDWILGYLFRLTSGGISRVAGLAAVEDIPDLENVDVTKLVPGHMAYRQAMPRLLKECGWLVDNEEFNEIEDPDPENHEQRQRELINEIEEARREFERQEQEKLDKGGKFSWLKKKKKKVVGKKEWETYEKDASSGRGSEEGSLRDKNDFVLFDIDAIRKELESENLEVRELKSTLPPMKIDLNTPTPSITTSPAHRDGVKTTKSADAVPTKKNSYEYDYDETADQEENTAAEPPKPQKPRKSYTYAGGVDDAYKQYHASPFVSEEPEVAMSFDTAYVSPAPSTPNVGARSPVRADNHSHPSTQGSGLGVESSVWGERSMEVSARSSSNAGEDDPWKKVEPAAQTNNERPQLTSSWTTPALPQGQDKNAWADDDDDDEFREKEVTMTFG